MNLNSLTQVQAAALLSVAPRTLRDWPDAPRNANGSYPAAALVSFFVLKQTGDELDLTKERARLAKEQADRTSLQNAIARGDVIPTSQAVTQWGNHIMAARAKWLSIPTKAAARCVGLTDVNAIAEILRGVVYEGLEDLSGWTPTEGGGAVEAAPEADSEPVGRHRKKAVERKQRRARTVED